MTTLPVIGEQPGFAAAMNLQPSNDLLCLGTASLLYQLASEEPPPEKPKEEAKKPPDEKPAEKPGEKKPDDKPKVQEGAPEFTLEDALGLLSSVDLSGGIHLPENTTPQNFFNRLCVALTAMKGKGSEPEIPPEIPQEGGAKKVDKKEEQPNYMMNLLETAKTNPALQKMIDNAKADRREKRKTLLADLKNRGLNPKTAEKLDKQLSTAIELSFTASGDPEDQEIDRQLALLDETLPKIDKLMSKTITLGNNGKLTEQPAPEATNGTLDEAKRKRLADEQVAASRRPLSCEVK